MKEANPAKVKGDNIKSHFSYIVCADIWCQEDALLNIPSKILLMGAECMWKFANRLRNFPSENPDGTKWL